MPFRYSLPLRRKWNNVEHRPRLRRELCSPRVQTADTPIARLSGIFVISPRERWISRPATKDQQTECTTAGQSISMILSIFNTTALYDREPRLNSVLQTTDGDKGDRSRLCINPMIAGLPCAIGGSARSVSNHFPQ